ncbi:MULTISPECIES: 4-aminobutyrate--2-oxoglutarate transaminase [Acidiphilium]|uniref:4-aminobutyrate aminotransferase apoenzyme n=1 Tax=Acidiphilium cryptum (strain JF-5) TaxID=349163 RepID=A5G0S2_ACICJ|nr:MULTISPECIES: 4-aminobutyrate--2-oxoglutarate transaminase [Acidiphilium]MBU6356753.1 4-aminobutyrate--2-oxoglutarate transaminase [Rhodospirillales bacterium]ABQ31454.1 4-aminobutyrate aminotransferase apoenzyme [Acidiphilium cryptum JF-5]EGO96122.1 4-aminobutyrate aminotransferase [Acidiphilium sp. PM]KDM67147.1 4-aminobutyrate aminotransferase PuuE [Acidiphilium sp. JA12-A1]UNC13826.1 4-aminobutyrate--2-oxoglutarate transaminase [Acidiphilium multivorum]
MSTNTDLHARREAAVARGVGISHPMAYTARAENAELWDADGKRYIDFAGGIAVLNTGHRHPKVIEAVKAQLDRFTHTCFQVTPYEPYVALAERLNAIAPIEGPAKTVFLTTGAEALENAIKIARAATGRPGVITFAGGYHGRTLLTMAMTGKVIPYKKRFAPMPAEIYHAPFPYEPFGVSVADSIRGIDMLFRADIEPERVAAIVIEPVQGEGGFIPAPTELLVALREICDRHGILLIVDEVQTGFGRTGKMFGIEHSGVKPDLMTIAKSLAGGFPLSGVIGRAAVMDAPEPGGLGGTYAGNPLACAAALAVLDVIRDENLVERANAIGATMKSRLERIASRNDVAPITAIRGPGAMIAFDIVRQRGSYEPDPDTTKQVIARAREHGLIVISCGVYGNAIRLLVPLTVSDTVLGEGMDALEAALAG